MNIAIVGATGLVGRTIINILNEKHLLKNNNIFLYASSKSDGKIIFVDDKQYVVKELDFKNLVSRYDLALFSAGREISLRWAPIFAELGAYVIDNSSAYRRNKNVPLVVPEINFEDINDTKKIISNPNCSTIGASLPIHQLSKIYNIKRIIISTYQAVSGAGQNAVEDLINGTDKKLPYVITNNLIPQIDNPLKNGYTYEEDKMEFELKKILHNQALKISTTCVRVPIVNCHSESINIEFDEIPDVSRVKGILGGVKGICVCDDLNNKKYPMPYFADGQDDIYVGRIRQDTSNSNAINLFISFDNIRKGAALNAVQIAEEIIKNK